MSDPVNLHKVSVLIEALPYIRKYQGATLVIKYGGHAMVDEDLKTAFAQDVTLLKYVGFNPVVVHGGGPQINELLTRLDIKSRFVDGLRYTDEAAMKVVEMVLAGQVGKEIVGLINQAGGLAVGLSGKDARLTEARRKTILKPGAEGRPDEIIDLGLVGEPVKINAGFLRHLCNSEVIPIISPTGVGADGEALNINADLVAGAVAGALKAEKLILMTDVEGVLDQDKKLIASLKISDMDKLRQDGVISGGMIPKIDCCREAIAQGCAGAYILDGRRRHSILLELFTDEGSGTEIVA